MAQAERAVRRELGYKISLKEKEFYMRFGEVEENDALVGEELDE